jgi:Na+/H+-dicarboxylate symporter
MTTVALAPLLSAVLGALVGAVSVTLAFSLVILGVARYADMRRVGRVGAARAYGAVGVAAAVIAIGIVALGLVVVTSR